MEGLTGQRFGHWTVVRMDGTWQGHRLVLCQCDCGVMATVRLNSLKGRKSTRCKECAIDLRAATLAGIVVKE